MNKNKKVRKKEKRKKMANRLLFVLAFLIPCCLTYVNSQGSFLQLTISPIQKINKKLITINWTLIKLVNSTCSFINSCSECVASVDVKCGWCSVTQKCMEGIKTHLIDTILLLFYYFYFFYWREISDMIWYIGTGIGPLGGSCFPGWNFGVCVGKFFFSWIFNSFLYSLERKKNKTNKKIALNQQIV